MGGPLSDIEPVPRSVIFVGGPGRSGTSFIADRMGRHPDVCSLPDIELKLLTEKNGVLDLFHALVQTYSPNRATVALDQFRKFFLALVDGRFGQPGLATISPREEWLSMLDAFLEQLISGGQAGPAPADTLHDAARDLLWRIADVAARRTPTVAVPAVFLEKTPHALLSIDFLARIVPGARYVHVMRDPRSIAHSLRKMRWGPDDLGACCTWVSNYLSAWIRSQETAARLGIFPASIRIEAVAANPQDLSQFVCRRMSLAPHRELFCGAHLSTLNGWAETCPDVERELLDSKLSCWAVRFGYSAADIGSPVCSSEPSADLVCA